MDKSTVDYVDLDELTSNPAPSGIVDLDKVDEERHLNIALIGDLHGTKDIDLVLEKLEIFKPDIAIQLGDYSFYPFHWDQALRFAQTFEPYTKFRIVLGNHDNWDYAEKLAEKFSYFVTKPRIENIKGLDLLMIPGAFTSDRHHRIIGFDLFEQEECSKEELERILEVYKEHDGVDIILSHCAATSDAFEILNGAGVYESRTSSCLQQIRNMEVTKRPSFWGFGHYHRPHTSFVKGANGQITIIKALGIGEIYELRQGQQPSRLADS